MAKSRMTLEGVAELTKQLEALGKLDDGKALRRGVRVGMQAALELAEADIPVGYKPHRLRNGLLVAPGYAKSTLTIKTKLSRDKTVADAMLGVGAQAFYATQFLELGTYKMAAQPWIRRAFFAARGAVEERFRDSLAFSIGRAIRDAAK